MDPVTKRASVQNVILENNYHRSQYKSSGARRNFSITLYDFGSDANVSQIQVKNPIIPIEDNTPDINLYESLHSSSNIDILEKQKSINQVKKSASFASRVRSKVIINTDPRKIVFDNVAADYQDNYDKSNGSFTAPFKGLYNVSFGLTTADLDDHTNLRVYIKGSITYKMFYFSGVGTGPQTHSGTCTVLMNKGDKLWLESETTNGTTSLKAGDLHNWFDITSLN